MTAQNVRHDFLAWLASDGPPALSLYSLLFFSFFYSILFFVYNYYSLSLFLCLCVLIFIPIIGHVKVAARSLLYFVYDIICVCAVV